MFKIYYDKINPYFDREVFDAAYREVSANRKKKIDSLSADAAKARSLAAEILLIKGTEDIGLSDLINHIEVNEHGKPDFWDGCGWHFNLSHSGEYVMLGIADSPIGVDIQEIKDMKANIADRFFHEDEKKYLEETFATDKEGYKSDLYLQSFFRIWCLKESFVKYTGRGLGQGLDTFSVLGRLEDSRILFDGRYASAFWI